MTVGINPDDRKSNESIDYTNSAGRRWKAANKKKKFKTIFITFGVSAAVVLTVSALLKKDKAITAEYLSSLEKSDQLQDKYDSLLGEHMTMIDKYLQVTEKLMDNYEKKTAVVKAVTS